MQAMYKLSVVREMAGAFAQSNEVLAVYQQHTFCFSMCTEDTGSNGRKVCSDLTCMSQVEFGFRFDWL